MIRIHSFIEAFSDLGHSSDMLPWEVTSSLAQILPALIEKLDDNYTLKDGIAIHKTATIESGVVIKGPAIIGAKCFVAAGAYLRGGVYLGRSVTIGPACEIKSSMIFDHSTIAHFNFIGDSIIGSHVNFEAGAIIANHYNERVDKRICVFYGSKLVDTGCEKFGALVGDSCKIGANAVLSPGTILPPKSIVRRLELVDQCS